MHALGNDFMVIDGVSLNIQPTPTQIQQWANRHTGIGFDQLLLIEKPKTQRADFFYRIFNADGSEVGQCGNGARCLALFFHETAMTQKNPVTVETTSSVLELYLEKNNQATVNMGVPNFDPLQIPFITEQKANCYSLPTPQKTFQISALSIGNPHCVLIVDNVKSAPVQEVGSLLTNHPQYPQSTNVEFMQINNPQQIQLRVYERGSGETLACGSGACAAVVAGRQLGLLDNTVVVKQPGGELLVKWQGENKPVFLTGPATMVFQGVIHS